jgi:hypothetical protein
MLWALLAPLGVMIFQGARQSLPWFFAYIALTAVSGFFDYYLTEGVEAGVTMQSIAVFFALNFAAMSTIIYLLISYFVRQRDQLAARITEQNELLRDEQEKSERLLLNILPGPIAQRLKQQHSIIAGFADVSVMFAVINFAPVGDVAPSDGGIAERSVLAFRPARRAAASKNQDYRNAYMVAGGLGEATRRSPGVATGSATQRGNLQHGLDMCNYMDTRSGFKRPGCRSTWG